MTVAPAAGAVAQRTDDIVAELGGLEGPLLPILHAVQEEFGYVPQEALPRIAERLNLTRAEVHGVMSFYHDFRTTPGGRHEVKICRAEACQSMGAQQLFDNACNRLGVGTHETTQNGAVRLEQVFCLGLCACGPSAMIDGKLVGRLDAERLDSLLTELGA